MYIEDKGGVYLETVDEHGVPTLVLKTEMDQQLVMDYITEQDTEKYFVQPGEQEEKDETETISSTSMADYDCEEVGASLTAIADAFHKISNEYEHLCSIVPHMSKTQGANVISRLPIIPFLEKGMSVKTETKKESGKPELVTITVTMTTMPVQMSAPGTTTSTEQEKMAETQATSKTLPVVKLGTVPEEEVDVENDEQASGRTKETEVEVEELGMRPEKMEQYNRYELSGKGETLEQKFNEEIKDINYHNMVVVIAVGDKVINNLGEI